jgi:hypothetical protein
VLVDPHHRGDVHDVVEIGGDVIDVDERRVCRRRALDVRARVIGVLVEGDGDDDEVVRAELLGQRLPDRQVLAAASPGGPEDEHAALVAVLGEGVTAAGEIGEGEVGGLERSEAGSALGGRRAEGGDARGGVEDEGAIEEVRDGSEIDAAREDRGVADGDAHVAVAESGTFELPAEGGERFGRYAQRALLERALELDDPALEEDGDLVHRDEVTRAGGARAASRSRWR